MRKLAFLSVLALLFFVVPIFAQSQTSYIGNKSSHKFHRPDCRYAEKMATRNRIIFQTRQEAVGKGYLPCKLCRP